MDRGISSILSYFSLVATIAEFDRTHIDLKSSTTRHMHITQFGQTQLDLKCICVLDQ